MRGTGLRFALSRHWMPRSVAGKVALDFTRASRPIKVERMIKRFYLGDDRLPETRVGVRLGLPIELLSTRRRQHARVRSGCK